MKRGSVSKYRNVEAKRRRVTIVEKDISPNLYDQNIAVVENLMQKCIRPMMTEIVTKMTMNYSKTKVKQQIIKIKDKRTHVAEVDK